MSVPTYRFASARVDITPDRRIELAGYAGLKRVWESIHSRLEATAVHLSDSTTSVLFISADLLYFGANLSAALFAHAAARGVNPCNVVLSASHTHFAPATISEMSTLGSPDQAYTLFLKERIFKLVDDVTSRVPSHVALQRSRVPTNSNINRRYRRRLPILTKRGLKIRPSIVMAPAEDAARDDMIDVIQIRSDDNQLVSVLWKFACHPVAFPQTLNVSAEYPGIVRELLRQKHNPDLPVIFWQGFAGDVRPRLSGDQSWMQKLHAIRRGPSFAPVDMPTWTAWAENIGRSVLSGVQVDQGDRLSGPIHFRSTAVPLTTILRKIRTAADQARTISVQQLTVGDTFEALFFGAEMCSPWLDLFGRGNETVYSGYAGDVFGYLPSRQQIIEGGYEGRDFLRAFGLHGELSTDAQEIVLNVVNRLRQRNPAGIEKAAIV